MENQIDSSVFRVNSIGISIAREQKANDKTR